MLEEKVSMVQKYTQLLLTLLAPLCGLGGDEQSDHRQYSSGEGSMGSGSA